MIENFDAFYSFMQRPENDGQGPHVTPGDPGGLTVYGWTLASWQAFAPQHGLPPTAEALRVQTKDSLKPLTRAHYWNVIQGDHLPAGVDVFWADFAFTSGGATRELQKLLGVTPDGQVGFGETIPAVLKAGDPRALVRAMGDARMAYYDRLGFRSRWPGLYARTKACVALALDLTAPDIAGAVQAIVDALQDVGKRVNALPFHPARTRAGLAIDEAIGDMRQSLT